MSLFGSVHIFREIKLISLFRKSDPVRLEGGHANMDDPFSHNKLFPDATRLMAYGYITAKKGRRRNEEVPAR